ncbi:MAG: 5'-nucleotidase C-terminal domain-containing protein [Candidatus Cloacimonadota bacterium]|nr:5'-nucleotidase C-terminal domain-containing protein [Candidatus Cloacimonadota bacterium]
MIKKIILKKLGWILLICFLLVGCSGKIEFENGKIKGVNTINELDKVSAFNFTIMSDNKGDSPESSKAFANMVTRIENNETEFVIGLGDHVKKGWENSFLPFLQKNVWWRNHFYPNIADGENEFYGENQGDWGSGKEFFKEINFASYPDVEIRENGCEYYAKIKVKDYTIHLIQLHYSDSPREDSLAFVTNSKQYLTEILDSIQKGKKDIVIAAAHSRTGFWIDQLDQEQKEIVMKKCDLVLSATTHFFERKIIEEFGNKGPLIINTGSITYPSKYCPFGYVQINVIKNPFSLVVQYIDAGRNEPEMQFANYAFIKIINGEILETDFRQMRPEENAERVIGHIPQEITKETMGKIAEEIYLSATDADIAYVRVNSGLEKGDLKFATLWNVFPYNNEIYVLKLTPKQVEDVFEYKISKEKSNEIQIAINNYNGEYVIDLLKLDEDKFYKTGKWEVPLLQKWVEKDE